MYKICWILTNTCNNEVVYGEGLPIYNEEMVNIWIKHLNEKFSYITHFSLKI